MRNTPPFRGGPDPRREEDDGWVHPRQISDVPAKPTSDTRELRGGSSFSHTEAPSSADVFGDKVAAIRKGSKEIDVTGIRRALITSKLQEDAWFARFDEQTRKILVEIIADLIVEAELATKGKDSDKFALNFHHRRMDEEGKLPMENISFTPRFADWLSEKYFTLKIDPANQTMPAWKLDRFSSTDLQSPNLTFSAKNQLTGEQRKVFLYEVLAGIRII